GGRPTIRSPRPDLDFARAVACLLGNSPPPPGIHPTAVVAPDAKVDPSAWVGPCAVVGARSTVGPRSAIHAGVVLYEEVRIGADGVVHAGCGIRGGASIGGRVRRDA